VLRVADIVAIDALRITVRGGAAGCDRPVRWVHISELADPTPWLRGGELLLTTGIPLAGDPAGYVGLLADAGLTGLGLGLGFGFDAAPQPAVEEADARGFPLFEIPYDVPFIALTEAVFTRLSDARVAEATRRLAGDLVEAVLGGDAGTRELRRRLRAFGLRGTLPLSFVALRPAVADAEGLARLADSAAALGPASVREGFVAVLVEARDDAEAERAAARLMAETGAGGAGVGRVRSDPAELARSYDEALYAAEARPVNGTPVVATFRDLGSIQLLLSLGDERGVELYCEAVLGPLRAHDARYGSALLESLAAYIEANGRWADAAAALGVHRHTLRYRIRKIEQLTGRSPADARDRLELGLALRAHELQGRRELEHAS
jgi:purine catabolism regulatory family protein/PucR-like helix-turn-helix protein/diguanylate cyclase with GGDEF domain